jgi:Cytochrome c7 and related cytochrome c
MRAAHEKPPFQDAGAALALVLGCVLAGLVALFGRDSLAQAQNGATPASVDARPLDAASSVEDDARTVAPQPAPPPEPAPPPVSGLSPRSDGKPLPEFDRPPGSLPGDGGPSPVIFPAQDVPIRFNHLRHVLGLGMSCTTCHDKAKSSHKSSDLLLPPATRCDACHGTDHRDLSRVSPSPTAALGQCAFCHLGYRAQDGNRVARVFIPSPNLHFDHARHAARNIRCAQCHGAVESLELATRDQLPRMRGCFKCHQMPAPAAGEAHSECATCHLRDPSGQVRVSFDSGTLTPPRWLHDAGHGPDWIERHKRIAGDDSQFCANCHSEKYCVDCHDGRVRPRHVHPNDWLDMHAIAARENSPTCTSCHRQQSFCLGCHQRVGVALSGPFANFAGRGRFHPPKSVWTEGPRSPSHHSWEAQRNLGACVSCHVERDCAICHATAAVGGRGPGAGQTPNPHPPGFLNRCAHAYRANARPCLVCHDPADAELDKCR